MNMAYGEWRQKINGCMCLKLYSLLVEMHNVNIWSGRVGQEVEHHAFPQVLYTACNLLT